MMLSGNKKKLSSRETLPRKIWLPKNKGFYSLVNRSSLWWKGQ